jgi:cell division protein FtsZ
MEETSIEGARAVLANITGNLTFDDYNEASNIVHDAVGDDANIFIGAVIDSSMGEEIRVTIIATGYNGVKTKRTVPVPAHLANNDPLRLVSYRPQRVVTDRPPILNQVAEAATVEPTMQAKTLTLERPIIPAAVLDDRNIPAFLRKQAD